MVVFIMPYTVPYVSRIKLRRVSTRAEPSRSLEKEWWLRALLVFQSPQPVFAALRDDADDAASARQEPMVAVVFLAGIAAVLASSVAGRLMDDPIYDGLLVAVWAIVAGGI